MADGRPECVPLSLEFPSKLWVYNIHQKVIILIDDYLLTSCDSFVPPAEKSDIYMAIELDIQASPEGVWLDEKPFIHLV